MMILNIYKYVVVAVDLLITTKKSESHLNETFRCCNAMPIVLINLLVYLTRVGTKAPDDELKGRVRYYFHAG